MWSRGLVSILLSILAIAESEKSRARVTFPFSEVIPSESYEPGFECAYECAIYATKETTIAQNGNIVYNNINVSAKYNYNGAAIVKAGKYTMSNARDYSNEGNFVVYVVKNTAPNYGTPVFLLRGYNDFEIKSETRHVTVLSNTNAIELSSFLGHFPSGYPKVYASGFDAVSDLYGVTSCTPVYQARSRLRSNPVIFSPIVTIDFGYEGPHSVSVKQPRYGYRGQKKTAGVSTVYMSPGYIGCPFVGNQNYEDDSKNGERIVRDSFTLIASSIDISVSYNDVRNAKFRVNQDILDFNSTGPARFSRRYGAGAFKIELDWRSYGSPTTSWAMQLDFGAVEQQGTRTNGRYGVNDTSTQPVQPTRAPWIFEDPRKRFQPSSPKYTTEATWSDYRNDTESWDVMGWADKMRSRFESHDSYQNNTQSDAVDWMEDHVRLLYICLSIFLVATVLLCVYRRKRNARNFEPLTAAK